MPVAPSAKILTVALIGNPNTGKSTLFSALVGLHQHVGNYPGVTVEKKTGQMQYDGRRWELVDLPGLYSLAPRSRDEAVAVDVLLGCSSGLAPVDAVVSILDASNLHRHLYLVSQVLEFHRPTVLAVNMVDLAEKRGIRIDWAKLARRLGVPVVPIQAHRRIGLSLLKKVLAQVVRESGDCPNFRGNENGTVPFDATPEAAASPFPAVFESEVLRLESRLAGLPGGRADGRSLPRHLVRRLLLDANGYLLRTLLPEADGEVGQALESARAKLASAGCAVPGIETTARFDWARQILEGAVEQPAGYQATRSDRIDRVLTHRVWGTGIFALVMLAIFQSVFVGALPLTNAINSGVTALGAWAGSWLPPGALRSLVADGIFGGVGGVLAFLPQILILFVFIAILEDCGYLARAACLMDRLMSRIGLSGKSFIPLLSSCACAIPGIMSARVIENERDRLTTILVAPLMTCSARLQVYALLIAAFVPPRAFCGGLVRLQGLTLAAMYALGILMAVAVALLLKRTILRGDAPPFVMELPSYKVPSLRTIFFRVVERGVVFLRCAGTLILAVSILTWALLYYPHDARVVEAPFRPQVEALEVRLAVLAPGDPQRKAIAARLADLDHQIAGAYQRQSWLGRAGRRIEPVFKPLGWDWRISSAVLASFPAREIVVATLGVIYNLGKDVNTESHEGRNQLNSRLHAATWDGSDRPVFNLPVAFSIMVFFALCAQCAATLAVIRRETNSWRWPLFTFAYMTTLAYVGALLTYQVGMWIAAGRAGVS
jgi:ferrous iron transport protein B